MKFLPLILISSIGWGQQLIFDDFESGRSWTQGEPDASISTAPETEANIGVFLLTLKKKEQPPQFAQRSFDRAWVENAHEVAKEFYHQASFGKMNITSSFLGEFTLEYDEPKCDGNAWARDALAQAKAQGIDLAPYRYRNFYVNTELRCPWAGIAHLNCGTTCNSWIVADHEDGKRHGVLIHEIGHNLGFAHAATDPNDDGKVDQAYGDQYDLMGNGWNPHRHFNAPHTRYQNWLEESNILRASEGIHAIAPLSENTADVKDLIADGYDISYRKRLDLDAQIPKNSMLGIWKQQGGLSLLIRELNPGEQFKGISYLREENGRAIVSLDPPPPEPEPTNGIRVKAYRGTWSKLPDFSQLEPVDEYFQTSISVGKYAGQEGFGLLLEGWALFDHSEEITFQLGSDDGSRLFIDDELIIDNDGLHGMVYKSAKRYISQGAHKLRIEFFERGGGERLDLIYLGAKTGRKRFNADSLRVRKPEPPENLPPEIEMITEARMKIGESRWFSADYKDPDGEIISASWEKISGPAQVWLPFGGYSNLFRFDAEIAGEYIFRFTVIDNGGASASKDLKVIVE